MMRHPSQAPSSDPRRPLLSSMVVACFVLLQPMRAFGWGEEGHQLIMRLAVEHLPDAMRVPLERHRRQLGEASIEPDRQTEGKDRHYLHLDQCAPGTSTPGEPGTLAATVATQYWRLVTAIAQGDRAAQVAALGDLAHFVGDTHQPLHTTCDDDGRLSGNAIRGPLGLHWRFEKRFVQVHARELERAVRSQLRPARLTPVNALAEETVSRARHASRLLPDLLQSDRRLFPQTGPWSRWPATAPYWTAPAVEQLTLATQWLADLILTAHHDARFEAERKAIECGDLPPEREGSTTDP